MLAFRVCAVLAIIAVLPSLPGPGQARADNGSQASQWELDNDFQVSDTAPELTWNMEAAFENHVNTREELDFADAYKKQEASTRFDIRYGTDNRYARSITDLYFSPSFFSDDIGEDYPYSRESRTYRNLRISGESGEIIFRELYYNWMPGNHRLRIGNQVYPWGTADGFNPTAYLNPLDLRELVLTQEDEFRLGVPSVSGTLFFSEVTLELVFVPAHIAGALPATGHFWAVKEVEDQYPVYFDPPEQKDLDSENFGYAARMSSTWQGLDFSVSAYHGPDNQHLLVPEQTVLIPNQPVGIRVRPRSYVVDYVGADFSKSFGDFVFNAEAAYAPNKTGIIEQDTDRPQRLEFPYETEETDYLAYSLGLNYYIPLYRLLSGHAGDSLLTVEWYQAKYFEDKIESPHLTDFLSCQYRDSFFDRRVKLRLTTIFETRRGGVIFWPRVGYDFKNGLEVELGYVGINGSGSGDYDQDSLFYYYRHNDLVMVNFKYAFF